MWACAILTFVGVACSRQDAPPAALDTATAEAPAETSADSPTDVGAGEFNVPPPDIKSTEKVRCLVDSPPGCDGCDKGDTCAYEELPRYDCVYVVYGTDCSK